MIVVTSRIREAHARIPAGLKVERVEEGVGEYEVL